MPSAGLRTRFRPSTGTAVEYSPFPDIKTGGLTLTLAPGARLGPYEITAAIGAGGMGEVWRATDTRLGRHVALKLLPAAFATDPDRLSRLEREAKLLASLNHSNIAHLYGFEQATLPDGSNAHLLVMELVEGEDLAERLKRGPIPVDEADRPSPGRSPRRSRRRTRRASSTATSSPRTSR